MIIGTNKDKLENIMRDMKRHTSERLRACIKIHPQESRREWMLWMMERAGTKNSNNIGFQLWRQDNHPFVMDDIQKLHNSLDYIHNNLVEAGIVEKAEDYLYSSARDYYGMKGMIDIIMVEDITV